MRFASVAPLALAAALAVVPILADSAQAAVITFSAATPGDFSGPVTESGFSYSSLSGMLNAAGLGHPGVDMEGRAQLQFGGGGGVLDIVAAGSGQVDFTYAGLDYAAFGMLGTGAQTLTVTGLRNGAVVGIDTYTVANALVAPYPNWTTELAAGLSGTTIDDLRITLNAGGYGNAATYFVQAIDNVVLVPEAPPAPSPVPEPASLALLAAGLLGLGLVGRRGARG